MESVKSIYRVAVDAVSPATLMQKNVNLRGNDIYIGEQRPFELTGSLHVIGFGKAVLSMGIELHNLLGPRIKSGILSIPENSTCGVKLSPNFLEAFTLREGARNNLPDENSFGAAREILNLISSLDAHDLVIVLISGGGSSLLPVPIDGVTLQEKQETISLLSHAGASIQELNTVRRRLSKVKGEGLLHCTKARMVSIIISDVINDALDVIASGPTCPTHDSPHYAWKVIEKFNLKDKLPHSVIDVLTSNSPRFNIPYKNFAKVHNIVIGSNTIALNGAKDFAHNLGFDCLVLTNQVQGPARGIGVILAFLAAQILAPQDRDNSSKIFQSLSNLYADPNLAKSVVQMVQNCLLNKQTFCLLLGGETTVQVVGKGKGGRNQEMVLSWALQMHKLRQEIPYTFDIVLLSAGTDGIDGPTDAAGAIGTINQIEEAILEDLYAEKYLEDNDSYNFYSRLRDGHFLLKTGHTGTNVMDVIVLLFTPTCR